MTVTQAAEALGLSPHTLHHWRWRHKAGLALAPEARRLCESMITLGRSVRVPAEAVEAFRSRPKMPAGAGRITDLGRELSAALEAVGRADAARVVRALVEAA